MLINLKRTIKYIGDRKLKFFIIILISLFLEMFYQVIFSNLNKSIFNSIEYRDFELFKKSCIVAIIYVFLKVIIYLLRYLAITETRYIVFKIKNDLFYKLTKLNMGYFDENHSGAVLKKLNDDSNRLKDLYFSTGYWVIRNFCIGVVSIILMFNFSLELAIFSILFSLINMQVILKLNKKVYKKSSKLYSNISKLSQYLSDILSGFLIIKIYDNDNFIQTKYNEENNQVYSGLVDLTKDISFTKATVFLFGMISEFGVILYGIILTTRGKLDYGTLMAVIALQSSVSNLIMSFSYSLSAFTSQLANSSKVFDFLELEETEEDKKEDLALDYSKGIQISDLSFCYKNRDKILNNYNLKVEADEKIILFGHSGCGKSTILKLLLRLYEDYDGEIKIYGNNIKNYSLSQLREFITYIPQNNYLFDATVLENIKFGNENATDEEVKKACDDAFATEFINLMPNGFDTIVEKGGSNMSGGQRQRIAIARAFIRNSKILLMDEPTSSLDAESEIKINLAMKKLMENKIVIMVTHKKIGVENFDRIVEV